MKHKTLLALAALFTLACAGTFAPQATALAILGLAILSIPMILRTRTQAVADNSVTIIPEALGMGGRKSGTYKMGEAISAGTQILHVKKGSTDAYVVTGGASTRSLGVIYNPSGKAIAAEELVTVHFFGCGKTLVGIASEAMTSDDEVFQAASGKFQDRPSTSGTYWQVGGAVTSAGDDGDAFEFVSNAAQKLVIA